MFILNIINFISNFKRDFFLIPFCFLRLVLISHLIILAELNVVEELLNAFTKEFYYNNNNNNKINVIYVNGFRLESLFIVF